MTLFQCHCGDVHDSAERDYCPQPVAIVDRPAPTAAPALDLDAAEKRADGFRGRFRVMAYDSGDELLEFVALDAYNCDESEIDGGDVDEIAQFACDDETKRAIVATLNEAPALIAEARALRAAAEERERDMHARIRAGYDKAVADAWRAEVAKRDAEIADLRALVESQRRDYLDVCDAIAPETSGPADAAAKVRALRAKLAEAKRLGLEAVGFNLSDPTEHTAQCATHWQFRGRDKKCDCPAAIAAALEAL